MSVVTINDVYHFLRKVRKFSECRTSFGKVRFNSDCKLRNLSKDLLILMYKLNKLHILKKFSFTFAFTVCPLVCNYILIYVHGIHTADQSYQGRKRTDGEPFFTASIARIFMANGQMFMSANKQRMTYI